MPRRERDSCANYNAFGYDPDGRIACISGMLFGPDWTPPVPLQQFVGRLEPPRYGPPAYYQRSCLPEGFTPNPPPDFYPSPPYIDPPTPWEPFLFDAIRCAENFEHRANGCDSDGDDDYMSDQCVDTDPVEDDLEKRGDDGGCNSDASESTETIANDSDDEDQSKADPKDFDRRVQVDDE